MSQTDPQAALAAAALIVSSEYGNGGTLGERETCALQMADAFLAWLKRPGRTTIERLVPNEDFRSPGHAQTERINPNDVTFAAAERERMASAALAAATEPTMPWRTVSCTAGPHTLSLTRTTPSGARACECGEKWPCSQSEASRRIAGLPR